MLNSIVKGYNFISIQNVICGNVISVDAVNICLVIKCNLVCKFNIPSIYIYLYIYLSIHRSIYLLFIYLSISIYLYLSTNCVEFILISSYLSHVKKYKFIMQIKNRRSHNELLETYLNNEWISLVYKVIWTHLQPQILSFTKSPNLNKLRPSVIYHVKCLTKVKLFQIKELVIALEISNDILSYLFSSHKFAFVSHKNFKLTIKTGFWVNSHRLFFNRKNGIKCWYFVKLSATKMCTILLC